MISRLKSTSKMATSTPNYFQPLQEEETLNLEENNDFLTFEDDVVLARCPEMVSYREIYKKRLQNRKLIFADCLPVKFERRNAFMKKSKWHAPKRKPMNPPTYKIKKSPFLKTKREFLPILPPVTEYLKQKCISRREETNFRQSIPVPEEKAIMDSHEDMGKPSECVTSVQSLVEVMNSRQEIIEDSQAKTWNKKDASLLSNLFQKTDFLALTMREKNETQLIKEEPAERVNQSAVTIDVKSTKVLQHKTLKDVLNPKVGNTVLHPSNTFQTELLTGVPLIYDPSKKDIIVTGTEAQYKKYQQQEYPPPPDEWYPSASMQQRVVQTQKSTAKSLVTEITKFEKGFIRWVALPEVMDTRAVGIDNFHRMKDGEPSTQPKITVPEKSSMEQVLDMWQLKWQLTPGLASSSVEDIFLDMADLHPNVRCLAVITAAKIAIQCKCSSSHPTDSLIMIARKNKNGLPNLLETIISAVQCMLGDPHENVKMAAALALFCLEQENDKAESVVRVFLSSHTLLKRWVAAQCLGYAGYCDSDVISEVIHQTFASTDMDQVAQGIHLLIKISSQSSLVQFLVAEHLNSSRWQSKVMACQLFPQLHSQITKDISDKIKSLMWSDWHAEVRLEAAHCLGKTKLGKEVHDDLLLKLKHPDSQVRIKAIRLIGHLGMMTRKLALQFLQCFEDPHVSVRCETCIACGKLQIADPEVLKKLVDIATHDPLWKLKALSIQALGQIGVCSEEIKNCLLWSVHYSNNYAIRAEACRSLRLLKEQSPEVVLTLQERFLVENDPSVKKELQKSLMEISGLSPIDETDEVQKVKHAVRMLSTPRSVTQHVILMDHWLQSQSQPTSLDCPSQVHSGADSSKITGTSLPNTTQTKYPEGAPQDKGKPAHKIPLAFQQNTKTGKTKGKHNEQNQSEDDPIDPSRQNPLIDKIQSDIPETRTFLTEVQPQLLNHGKQRKKEIKPCFKNESEFIVQDKKKNRNDVHDSMTYNDLVEQLSNLAGDSPKNPETNQARISSDELAGKGLIEKDNFVGCFNDLRLRYADFFSMTDKFTKNEHSKL